MDFNRKVSCSRLDCQTFRKKNLQRNFRKRASRVCNGEALPNDRYGNEPIPKWAYWCTAHMFLLQAIPYVEMHTLFYTYVMQPMLEPVVSRTTRMVV